MSRTNFLLLGIVSTVLFLFLDVLAYPLFSFSLLFFSGLFLFRQNYDMLYIMCFIQLIDDMVLLRPIGLTISIWIASFYLMSYLNEKYLFYEHKYFQTITFFAIYILLDNVTQYIWNIADFIHLDILFKGIFYDFLAYFVTLFIMMKLGSRILGWVNRINFLSHR